MTESDQPQPAEEEASFWDVPMGRRRDLAEETAVVAGAAAAGIFHALDPGARTAPELARELDLQLRPVEILLAFLADAGLLTADAGEEGSYALTDRSRRALAEPDGDDYIAGGLPLWVSNLRAFTRLPSVLESGGPVEEDGRDGSSASDSDSVPESDRGKREGERLARFMAAMNAAPRDRIRRIVDLCLERVPEARRVLDLGGGPGHMSREFARRGLDVVLFDRPETVRFVATEYGLEDEDAITLVGGDFLEDPLPDGPFDVVLMSNILHIYSPETNRRLVGKAGEVTGPGGVGAIAEFVRGVSPRAARFALVMLLKTEEGNTYTEEEYAGWLRDAGFRDPRLEHLDGERQLVTAVRT